MYDLEKSDLNFFQKKTEEFTKNKGYHTQKSNWFLPDEAVRQNWCSLRRNDEYKKFRVFPEVCDSGIFETSEPKTEPPELPKHW